MFPLYKKRNFNALINDTFTFLKVEGKNYYSNYIVINGGFLLILLLLIYLLGKVFFEAVFSNLSSPSSQNIIEDYFNDNAGYFIIAGVAGGILLLLLTVISYSFPVLYLKEFEHNAAPTTAQILKIFREKAGKIIIFSLLWLVTFFPVLVLLSLLSVLLIAIIIGIPFVIIVVSAMSCWMSLSLYDYLNTDNGYFTSMKNGFNMLFQNFWANTGASAVIYVIIYVAQGIISFVPYFIGLFIVLLDSDGSLNEDSGQSAIATLLIITFMLSVLLSYLFGNIFFLTQGMIYYSSRENKENKSLYTEIDLIGSDGE